MIEFDRKRHIQYFLMNLKKLPRDYIALDSNRLTLVHFSVQSLQLLNFFDNNDNADFKLQLPNGDKSGFEYKLKVIGPLAITEGRKN